MSTAFKKAKQLEKLDKSKFDQELESQSQSSSSSSSDDEVQVKKISKKDLEEEK
jgi:hypothetical protein